MKWGNSELAWLDLKKLSSLSYGKINTSLTLNYLLINKQTLDLNGFVFTL